MPQRPKVVIAETLDDRCARWLGERAEVVWRRHDEGDRFGAELADARGLVVRTYTRVDDALLDRAPALRVVGRAGVGLDNVDLPACRARGVRVVYTPDANTQAVVEYVLALILDRIRPRAAFGPEINAEAFHRMRRELVGTQLDQLTLGILGFGRIGKRLGRAAEALGVRVLVHDLLPEAGLRALAPYPFEFVDRAQLFARSDVLSVHVDGRPENLGLIDAQALAQLRPSCLFINAARGMLVDSAAVAAWLRAHEADGAYALLDVHDPDEPPGPAYPLLGVANARLLPHLASRTHVALENMSWVVRDVVAVLEGREPQFPAWA